MSYNIDTFRVKKLENLKIIISNISGRYIERKYDPETGLTDFFENETLCITGKAQNGILSVQSISCYGEGSGSFVDEVLEDALEGSTGIFVASCVWEGGDCINQIRVNDGELEWVDVDV